MKTSRKILIWITGAGAVFALTAIGIATIRAQADQGQGGNSPVQAGPRRPGPGGGRGFGGPFGGGPFAGPLMPRVRDLTDAQREQMKAIADRHQPEIQPVMEQLRTAQAALDEAIVSNPTDEATIRLKSADVAAAEAELAVIRARIYSEVLTVLTPEQEQRSRMRERLQSGPRQQAGR